VRRSPKVHFDWAPTRPPARSKVRRSTWSLRPACRTIYPRRSALIHALGQQQTPTSVAVFDKAGIRGVLPTHMSAPRTLQTPLGELATVIYRTQRANASRSTRYWCALPWATSRAGRAAAPGQGGMDDEPCAA